MEDITSKSLRWFWAIPMASRVVLLLCVAIYMGTWGAPGIVRAWCLLPSAVVGSPLPDLYRLLTAPFVHLGLLHILFNGMTLVPLASWMERRVGSMAFLLAGVLGPALVSAMQLAMAVAVGQLPDATLQSVGVANPMYSCSAGYSGMLFTLLVIKVNVPGAPTSQAFCGFSVPARLYPLVLLMVIQLMWPQVSFFGHLAGILVGYLYTHGLLSPFLRWTDSWCRRLDSACAGCCAVARADAWIAHPATDPGLGGSRSDANVLPMTAPTTSRSFPSIPVVAPPPFANHKPEPFSGPGHRLGGDGGSSSSGGSDTTSTPTLPK